SVFPGCRILHRDLKPNNIGFLPDGRLALFDFGLARLWRVSEADPDGNETRKLTGNTGSLRYMAPEVALAKPYSHKAEVFAFATVLWEMASHERPFADCDVDSFYRRVCSEGQRPPIPQSFPPQLAALLTRCWSTDHAARPEMAEVIVILRELIVQLSPNLISPRLGSPSSEP
ncbi:serine threonine-protein kinase ctr1, partial [Chrysochromulina tobinii]